MKPMRSPIGAKCIYRLPEVVWIEGEEHAPSINRVVPESGALWAMGQQVLLRSIDGIYWEDASANLRLEGSFFVSSIIESPEGMHTFSRSKHGLRCYRWNQWERKWAVLFDVPSSAPGLYAAWTHRGVVVAARRDPETEFFSSEFEEHLRGVSRLPGMVVHFQMTPSGVGLCASWGTARTSDDLETVPSGVFFTTDFAVQWRSIATLNTMLHGGASIGSEGAILGGSGGFLATITRSGVEQVWQEDDRDFVAVDVLGTCRIAILEPCVESQPHGLMLANKSDWNRRDLLLEGRARCIKLLNCGEAVVCTDHAIFRCSLE